VTKNIEYIIGELEKLYHDSDFPDRNAFQCLIATILSQRTRDEQTDKAAGQLFSYYGTPEKLAGAPQKHVMELIKPAGFYRAKSGVIIEVSRILVEKYGGKVPDDINELTRLPGVGRKTANCVLAFSFKKDVIPVDTHVHRISNRLGLVKTKTPEQTELALMGVIPKIYWRTVNKYLVRFGQNICRPIKPRCCECPIAEVCPSKAC